MQSDPNLDSLDTVHAEPVVVTDKMDMVILLATRWRLLTIGALLIGVITAGITLVIPPTFTARTTFLPPQQHQGNAVSALASLGSLAGLAGAATGGLRTPADQYVALMQSLTVTDRIIDRFKLMEVYKADWHWQARKALANRVQISVGKKDGLVSVEVDDHSPQRAADIANRYVEELRNLTGRLALTEAQQRRVFFELHLNQTKIDLAQAQQALLASGYGENSLKAEPKVAADGYAKLRAELTSAEARLQVVRSQLLDRTPEVVQQTALVSVLRTKLASLEHSDSAPPGPDYVSKYREFKYQETLFELFSRQYEAARVDESRDGLLIQVIDPAQPPELKSKPARTLITLGAMAIGAILIAAWILMLHSWRRYASETTWAAKLAAVRDNR